MLRSLSFGSSVRIVIVIAVATSVGVITRVSAPFSSGAPASRSSEADARTPLLISQFVDVETDGVSPEDYFRYRARRCKQATRSER